MSNVFDINKLDNPDEYNETINLDELYEKKQAYDISQLNLYKKMLARVHIRIKTTSRQSIESQFCWYVIPEVILGVPKYDQGACIGYLMHHLKENGFVVNYTHPNLLFISWKHWVPSYVRTEIKKRTGMQVDGYGNIKKDAKNNTSQLFGNQHQHQHQHQHQSGLTQTPGSVNPYAESSTSSSLKQISTSMIGGKQGKKPSDHRSISEYKPSGMIYKNDFIEALKKL